MLELSEVVRRLQDRRPGMVVKATGLSWTTVTNIRDGHNSPTYKTLKKLSDYLEAQDRPQHAQE